MYEQIIRIIEDFDAMKNAYFQKYHGFITRADNALPGIEKSDVNAIDAYIAYETIQQIANFKSSFGKTRASRPSTGKIDRDRYGEPYTKIVIYRTMALVALTCIVYSWVYVPGRHAGVDSYTNRCIANGHAVVHQVVINGREMPVVTFMTMQAADGFVRVLSAVGRDTSAIAKHWAEVVMPSAMQGNLQFQFKEFTTPTILSKFLEYYGQIAGVYTP